MNRRSSSAWLPVTTIVATLLTIAGYVRAEDTEAQIRKFESQLNKAVVEGDVATFDRRAHHLRRNLLPVVLHELRLVVEELELARAAGHEEKDDVLRARCEVRRFCRVRMDDALFGRVRPGAEDTIVAQQSRKRHRTDADARLTEEVAAGDADGCSGTGWWIHRTILPLLT